jgi:paraquat-inducible protein A
MHRPLPGPPLAEPPPSVAITITCTDCGSTQELPDLPPGARAECHRCHRPFGHRSRVGNEVALACAAATFLLMPPAVFMPLMDSTILHLVFESSRLVSSVPEIYSEVWFPFAFGFLFFAFVVPAFRALLMIVVLGSLRARWKVGQRGRLFRWSEALRIWSMTDVVVIAGIIAYYRADVSAEVDVRVGAWSYVAVAVLAFIADRTLDRRAVWNAILPDRTTPARGEVSSCDACELTVASDWSGRRCPRCGNRLDRVVARGFAPALGAVAAAIPLCLPAYSASVIVNQQLTGVLEHTVLGTVVLFTDRGYWQFGVVTFVAGVVIPILTLVGMIWLLARVRFPARKGLVLRTRFYRLLYRLVRWPMIIPFIAAIAAPIVDFHGIDDIVAGYGATPLFMLIVLMMLSIRLFEPRLMWTTAGET